MSEDLAALYSIASDYEASVLDDLRERAGQTWTCRVCPWTMPGEDKTCEQCGRTIDESRAAEREA